HRAHPGGDRRALPDPNHHRAAPGPQRPARSRVRRPGRARRGAAEADRRRPRAMTREPTAEREIHSWLTDMDGVLVHEGQALPGAPEFVRALRDAGRPFLVLTNNSFFTERDLRARLRTSGIEVPSGAIWTSALATADFLADQVPGGS